MPSASKLTQSGLIAKTSVEDGGLYVRISASGTALFFRQEFHLDNSYNIRFVIHTVCFCPL